MYEAPAQPSPLPVVLVVDDDPSVRGVVEANLSYRGFAVRAFGDGPPAIEFFRGHHSQVFAVLLDVRIPGMDGPTVLRELRQLAPSVRAFFITGDPAGYTGSDLLALGATRVFTKPLNFNVVAAELRRDAVSS